ncbi:type II toxin-antitoxin system VapC family toxin [Actinokineospora inagensis]|uniref:type II toxin-antitoxin system VapC family toxin n=1 Tax=Actinokineospora inagensis TaxID=103730 RepID=UPI0003FE2789|nr:type II toxin-antitoxin system VapC family toxin [Actinokineospora inagensis]
MIVLDTNVVSELMRQSPDDTVVRWVDRYPVAEVYLTAVTAAELTYGVARVADGRRKETLVDKVAGLLAEDFQDRILPFDTVAAEYYGDIVSTRERAGLPISMADALIASICRSHAACLGTRNVKDFVDTGIALRDPWGDS